MVHIVYGLECMVHGLWYFVEKAPLFEGMPTANWRTSGNGAQKLGQLRSRPTEADSYVSIATASPSSTGPKEDAT